MALPTPAFKGSLSVGGTSTATTAEACALVSGKTYRITNTAKRVLDPGVARTWKDNAVAVSAANILGEDLLFGTVTFIPAYTVTGPVTLDASYVPRVVVANVTSAKFDIKGEQADVTSLQGAAGAGVRQRITTELDLSASLSLADPLNAVIDGASGTYFSTITGRTTWLMELVLDAGVNALRAWVNTGDGADVAAPADVIRGSVSVMLASRSTAAGLAGVSIGTI